MSHPIRLGNDIVDLSTAYAQNKHLQQRFLQRVFTPQEQQAIHTSPRPTTTLWAIWAAKEAVFKAAKKNHADLIFAHRQFALTTATLKQLSQQPSVNSLTGCMHYQTDTENFSAHLSWQQSHQHYVHCIALLDHAASTNVDWSTVASKISRIQPAAKTTATTAQAYSSAEYTQYSRSHAQQFLQDLGLDPQTQIKRIKQNIGQRTQLSSPKLYLHDKLLAHEISLSHDGNWLAVCFKGRYNTGDFSHQ
jgi:phosphopantetheine--protein transferase-like protein